ncbi:MAG: 1,4-alpha-glucan (glycogen) branching enzyme, GH-13-type (EC 2.4.1.18) [Olavius algarvensis Gamma 1 endosymbiont]|nr:MAG: 1,4-alpha-glucan (glycogen) branching enzyme, GH-13-type (EC 2.4.1.18) [Olavius algarvensis Gamma 1 endosymbiont]
MTAKKPSSTTQSADKKGSKKTATARADTAKPGPAAQTPPGARGPSGAPDESAAGKGSKQATTAGADASKPKPPAQTLPGAQGPSGASAGKGSKQATAAGAGSPDGPTAHSAINALEVMKKAETDKGAAQARTGKGAKPISAAQAIAKAAVRDYPSKPRPPKLPSKPVAAKKKPVPTSSPTADLPEEPKEPIGGVGAEGLPPPVVDSRDVEALLNADHPDPFAFLGMHATATTDALTVRVFVPGASAVEVLDVTGGKSVTRLERVHDEGLFVGAIRGRGKPFPYRLRITTPEGKKEIEDPYRFPPVLSDADTRELRAFTHLSSYRILGAHPTEIEGVAGVAFAVWAPNAGRVAVIGDFNGWDGRRHGMRLRHECGVWELFIPGVESGALYKYEIKTAPGTDPLVKSDPYAFRAEPPPGSASMVRAPGAYRWGDSAWLEQRKEKQGRAAPLSFYEVHPGSWRRKPEEDHRWLSYRELADDLVEYVTDLGFTHIALLPVSEHTFDDTVGFLPSALFAPTSRYGTPDDLRYLIDTCHRAGIGVVVDWVPNFLSAEPQGLALFDGTALYEDTDSHHSHDPDWEMPLYNLGSPAVVNYLLANALYWLDQFHLDGLRIDSLAKLLYLDYGRGEGQWVPNKDGGNESLEALDFVRRLTRLVGDEYPGVLTIAEDSSLRKGITTAVKDGGLGFSLRWNSAWAYDTLRYLRRHPVHRKYYHYELINPLNFAFDEHFVLPVSHDHVSIGQGAMTNKIPGDHWQRFATLRAWLALTYAMPGKKLMFMGTEFAQNREWNSTISLDWHLLQEPMHLGVQRLIRDFNRLVRETPALHELDAEASGFEWIDTNDEDSSIVLFARYGKDRGEFIVAVTHFTPVVRPNYRIGVPEQGYYREVLNTDAEVYGGGNWGSEGGAMSEQHGAHGREHSICLTLPPYATVVLKLERDQTVPKVP